MNRVLYLFVLLANLSFAQDIAFQVEKSNLFEDDYKDSEIVLAEKTENNQFIIVRDFSGSFSAKRGYYIEKYDTSLQKIGDYEFFIEQSLKEKYRRTIGVFLMNSKLNIVEMFYSLEKKQYICQLTIVDETQNDKKELIAFDKEDLIGFGLQNAIQGKQDGRFIKETYNSVDIENIFKGRTKKSSKEIHSQILFNISKSKSNFTIGITHKVKNNEVLKLFMFDAFANEVFQKEFVYDVNDIYNQNIILNEDGKSLYITQKNYSVDSKPEGGNYFYEIIKVSKNESESILKIDVDHHYLPRIETYFNDDKLYFFGLYSDRKDYKYSGVTSIIFDTKLNVVVNKEFSLFNDDLKFDKFGKVKEKEFEYFIFKDIYFGDDFICLNAEEQFVSGGVSGTFSGVNNNIPMGVSNPSFNYDDILSFRFDLNGNLKNQKIINKYQAVSKDSESGYISHSSIVLDGETYFFINTKDDVRKISNDRIEFKNVNKNNSNLFVIKLYTNGNFEYKEVLSKEDNEVPFMVSKGVIIDNSVFFLGRKGKNKQLLKVTL
jgi:hypothetical protein